jgi:hypothetical protein
MDSSHQDTRIVALEQRLETLERRLRSSARRARLAKAIALVAVVGAGVWTSIPEARAQFGLTLANLNARLLVVEAKTAPISVVGTDFAITGKNVFIQDGSGQSGFNSSLGNLTIGYNELRRNGGNNRSGTHNLIVGDQNNYTSFGGFVAGSRNEISSRWSSVSGGNGNSASGDSSSVSGGAFNIASGELASVSGGALNTASGVFGSVSGGEFNTAAGELASVSGGQNHSAPNLHNWAAGGLFQAN